MRSVSRYSVAIWSALSFFLLLTAWSSSSVMAAQDALICPADRINSNGNICTASDVSLAAAAVAVSQTGLTCNPGETIDVAIAGTVNLRKGDRFDIGVWVSTDGKPMDLRGGSGAGIPDEGGAQNCEVVPLPSQLIAKDSDPGVFVIDSLDDAATPQDCYDTKAANNGDVSTGFALTSERDSIINGLVDSNNDGAVDVTDDTTAGLRVFGAHIIAGGVDIDDSGVIDAGDDGVWNGYAVQDGVIDVDGDGNFGEVDGTDDSDQSFNDLVTMLCVAGPTGQLALETLVSWHVPSDAANVCTPTIPDTYGDFTQQGDPVMSSAKCSVSSSEVAVDIVGKLTIVKTAAPGDGTDFEFTYTNTNPPLADQDPNDAIPNISPISPFTLQHLGFDEIFAEIGTGPATIVITETNIPAGWDLDDLTCVGDDLTPVVIDLANDQATVTLEYNAADPINSQSDVFCTFVNKTLPSLEIVKNTAGGNGVFDFTGNNGIGAFQLDTGVINTDSTTFTNLQPGNDYSITETIPASWSLGSATCSNASGSLSGGALTGITLALGENVTCTFNNSLGAVTTFGKITVGGDGTFDFTSDLPGGNFSRTTSGGASPLYSVSNLAVGTYVITENAIAGWELTAMECTEDGTQDSTVDLPSRTITIRAQVGETIACTATNEMHATLQVNKQTDPDGDPATFEFTGTVNGTVSDNGNLSFTGAAGVFTTDETTQAGWDLTGISCGGGTNSTVLIGGTAGFVAGDTDVSATMAPGETVLCIYSNTKRGTVTIAKHLTALGPLVQDFDFTSDLPGNANFTLSPVDTGTDDSVTVTEVLPGTYFASETDPASNGWALASASCTDGSLVSAINVDPGENVTCTFNNAPLGSTTIIKNTVGGDDTFAFTGDAPIGVFNLDTSTGTPGTASIDFTNILPAGIYDVVEDAPLPAGWALTAVDCVDDVTSNSSGDVATATATIDVDLAETVTCSFENTADGTLVIEKQTLPDGDPTIFTFTGDVAGAIADGAQLSTSGQPGTYTSDETPATGYVLTGISCTGAINSTVTIGGTNGFVAGDTDVSVDLAAGETVTCIYTNTRDGSLTIIKDTVGGDGSFSFNHTVPAVTSPFVIDTAVDDTNILSVALQPGSYSVSEVVPTGWNLTDIACIGNTDSTITIGGAGGFDPGDEAVAVDMLSGEDIICTFTNTQQGNILVDKVTDPTGSTQSFDFTSNYGSPFSLTDTDPANDSGLLSASLVAGTYSVSEAMTASWDQTSASCTGDGNTPASITLLPGETVTCTFVNTQRPVINLAKTVNGPATLENDGTYTVVYTITASNTGGPGVYDLVDTFSPGSGITLNLATAAYVAGTENSQTGTLGVYPNFVTGESLADGLNESWTVTANFTVDPALLDPQSSSCDPGTPVVNTGFYNAVTGSSTETDTSDNDACTGLRDPLINLAKTVNGPATLEGDGTYTVVYTITASNTGGPGVYDLVDTFSPGSGITLNTATAAYVAGTENAQTGTLGAYPNFVTTEGLAEGLNESWTVTANFTVDPAMVDPVDSQCDPAAPAINTGFYNAVAGSDTDTDLTDNDTCTGLPLAILTVMKVVNGGNASPADFALTLTGIDGTHDSGMDYVSGDTPAVQVGVVYTLFELANQVPDYVDGGVVCTDDSDNSQLAHPVTLSAGQSVTCTQTNSFTLPPAETIPVPVNDKLALLLLILMMLVTGSYFRPATMRRF